jgi:hypothetical protein
VPFTDNDIRKVEDLEDGSTLYEIGEILEEAQEEAAENFYANLAIDFPEGGLKKLSSYLLEAIEEDLESRKDWIDSVEKCKNYLGFSIEDLNDIPFSQANRTFDTTLSTILFRWYSTTRAESLPAGGPAGYRINGVTNEQLENIGETRRDYLNYYLTVKDQPYYSDFERLILYLGLYGCCFKKVYYDKLQQRVLSRFILPENFIIDNDCTSILESTRLTHVLHLSKREILLNQQKGIYRDVELKYLKFSDTSYDDEEDDYVGNKEKNDIDLSVYTKRSLFPIYEIHTYLNLEDFTDSTDKEENAIPLPYIVTIDKISKEVLSITRNWKEEDPDQQRINYFIHYNLLPGFGIYGFGYAHLLGTNAITLTKLLRQIVDAGTFKNFPGGFRVKGFKQQQTDLVIGPGQFQEVDTGGMPLQQSIMPLPFSEPSSALRETRMEIINSCKELGSSTEMGMLNSKEDIPTGTLLALLEEKNRIQSAALRSFHYSLTQELQLIDKIFAETLENETFTFNNDQKEITSDDFVDDISIIPIADPSSNSILQRTMKAKAVLEIALQDPSVHNMREIYRMNYRALGLDDTEIDNILLPNQSEMPVLPLNPISENMNISKGLPVKAAIWQFHPGHIISHGLFAEENPDLKPEIMAHIQEHKALEYQIKMQNLLGIELPPLEEEQDPQMQNAIAMALAEKLDSTAQTDEQEMPPPIDPNALLMAEIEQKNAEIAAKERMADQKAKVDILKARLNVETEKAKIESNEDIAVLKAQTELTKQENNNNEY